MWTRLNFSVFQTDQKHDYAIVAHLLAARRTSNQIPRTFLLPFSWLGRIKSTLLLSEFHVEFAIVNERCASKSAGCANKMTWINALCYYANAARLSWYAKHYSFVKHSWWAFNIICFELHFDYSECLPWEHGAKWAISRIEMKFTNNVREAPVLMNVRFGSNIIGLLE